MTRNSVAERGRATGLSSANESATQSYEYRSVRSWSKEINGALTSLRGEKNNFLNSRYIPSRHDGRVDGILSICGAEVSRGSLGVGGRRAQAPTPHAPALQAFLTEISQQTKEL